MTQHDLIISHIREFGKIIPAKVSGKVYKGTMFGSETPKRCRELRDLRILTSHREGRFEVFTLVEDTKPKSTETPLRTEPVALFDMPSKHNHYDN